VVSRVYWHFVLWLRTTVPLEPLQEVEVEDLRRAYESLALEGRRLQSTVAQMEREAASREAALAAKADEAASLAEASRAAQAQIAQYVMDLQVSNKWPEV
jgi:hypothetical protein